MGSMTVLHIASPFAFSMPVPERQVTDKMSSASDTANFGNQTNSQSSQLSSLDETQDDKPEDTLTYRALGLQSLELDLSSDSLNFPEASIHTVQEAYNSHAGS